VSDDGVERTPDSAVRHLEKPETGACPGPANQPEPNVRAEVEFKVAWVYITYTLKTENENAGSY